MKYLLKDDFRSSFKKRIIMDMLVVCCNMKDDITIVVLYHLRYELS